jgi:hypothetical protein
VKLDAGEMGGCIDDDDVLVGLRKMKRRMRMLGRMRMLSFDDDWFGVLVGYAGSWMSGGEK